MPEVDKRKAAYLSKVGITSNNNAIISKIAKENAQEAKA